jgi:hypothetical protein
MPLWTKKRDIIPGMIKYKGSLMTLQLFINCFKITIEGKLRVSWKALHVMTPSHTRTMSWNHSNHLLIVPAQCLSISIQEVVVQEIIICWLIGTKGWTVHSRLSRQQLSHWALMSCQDSL